MQRTSTVRSTDRLSVAKHYQIVMQVLVRRCERFSARAPHRFAMRAEPFEFRCCCDLVCSVKTHRDGRYKSHWCPIDSADRDGIKAVSVSASSLVYKSVKIYLLSSEAIDYTTRPSGRHEKS